MKRSSLALLLLAATLSGCIGYARGDGQGNVEVVTNLGTLGGIDEAQDDTAR